VEPCEYCVAFKVSIGVNKVSNSYEEVSNGYEEVSNTGKTDEENVELSDQTRDGPEGSGSNPG
jgi:hypothetical protein